MISLLKNWYLRTETQSATVIPLDHKLTSEDNFFCWSTRLQYPNTLQY